MTDQGYTAIPALFTVETNRLVLNRATMEAAGTYQVIVRNPLGEDRQDLQIIVEPRRGRGRGGQYGSQYSGHDSSRSHISIRLESRDEQSHQIGRDIQLHCSVHGAVEQPHEYTFTKDGRSLENSKIKFRFFY